MSGLFEERPLDLRQMTEAVEREIRMRESVYPRWVAGGKLRQDKADFEIRCMARVLDVLRALASDEPDRSILEAMARAADQEESGIRGEPSPWSFDTESPDFPTFREERLSAMREAWKEIRAHL